MKEHYAGETNAPRTGRRAAPVPAGFDPNDPYVREVLDLAAKSPGNKGLGDDDAVDFDRLAEEDPDAPPNFDRLAEKEASIPGTLVGFAVYGDPEMEPAPARPAVSGPAGPGRTPVRPEPRRGTGELPEFPVYGEVQPGALADIPVYADPAVTAGTGKPVYASRDVGATEKPDFYDDPSAVEPDHKIRFRPGSSYSPGRQNEYRADSRGVPVFAPGRSAATAADSYARASLVRSVLAGICLAAAAGMAVFGMGANTDYLEMKANGTPVTATVVSVVSESSQNEAAESAVDRLGVTTTEVATVEFTVAGTKYRHELSAATGEATALMETGTIWPAGTTVDLLVDPADPARTVVVDEDQPERVNLFTLIPLLPGALLAVSGVSARLNSRKMRAIAAAG